MTIYNKFNKLNIDTMPLGIEQGNNESLYFCTPKGAKIIGWAGVDGIHFCFIHGFGEMVFAVSPMNTPGNYVYPLASTFSNFLCLILACGNTVALEQMHGWNQKEFDIFLKENPVTDEQLSVLSIIHEKLHLEPMERPFTYIKRLQTEFDYSKITFTEGYQDFIPPEPVLPEWKVYFDGNFWGDPGRQRAGKEIPTNIKFALNDKVWHIPSVYACSKGLVIDFCVEVPIESIQKFINKWNLSPEHDDSDFTKEQQIQIETENPMAININPEIILNKKTIHASHGSGLSWCPCFSELKSLEAEGVLKHYSLNPEKGWVIWRSAFPWHTKHKPKISSLSITIKHDPVQVYGSNFNVSMPGEAIDFINPLTNTHHKLIIQEYEPKDIPTGGFMDNDYDFPTHCIAMSYTIQPELADDSFSISDSSDGDKPRKKHINPMEPQASGSAMAIGVIGSPGKFTPIAFGGSNQGKLRAVYSALYFEPVKTVGWKIIFHEKPCADMTVKIL